MSWIQENKFAATVIGVTVVISGTLFYLGMDARSSAEKARKNGNAAIAAANALRTNKTKPYPNDSNLVLVRDKGAKFKNDSEVFQNNLLEYRPEALPRPSPTGFNRSVTSHISTLNDYYKVKSVGVAAKGRIAFGLEDYSGTGMVEVKAARYLDYQRKALEYMFRLLADAKPTSLDSVFRTKLPEESNTFEDKKSDSDKKEIRSVYRSLPIEVIFTGSERSLKTFLQDLVNSEEYFFITRSVSIKSLLIDSPDIDSASFADDVEVDDPEVTDVEGDDVEEDELILKQVLGNEQIKVHLKIDLILFDDKKEVPFPSAKEAVSKKIKRK